jgi:YVTN family beta-propeller protein
MDNFFMQRQWILMQNHGTLRRLFCAGAAFAAIAVIAGCGTNFRPVVIPQPVTGPPSQPQSFAVVVSTTGLTTPGIATIIDYSGDTILAQSPIGTGPLAYSEDANGSYGYTINNDLTLTNFQVTTNLQYKNLGYSTLPTGAANAPIFAGMLSPSNGLWVPDAANNVIDVLTGAPETYKLSIPVAPLPVFMIGPSSGAQRNYSISQNSTTSSALSYGVTCNTSAHASTTTQVGEANGLETSSFTVSSQIPLGVCPVYALETPDQRRVFVFNRGSDTVTVINAQKNALDQCPVALIPAPGGSGQPATCPPPYNTNQAGQPITYHPNIPLSLTAVNALNAEVYGLGNPPNGTAGMPNIAGPVYAEYNQATNQLVIANYDSGTISIVDVSMDEYGNDSATFGTTYTVQVGNNPASVTVLFDGTRAYAANQSDGTVSIVDLSSHTLEKTLPVNGNPWSVVSTQNSQYGKVYVASPNSPYLTIIRTDLDIVDTALLVEGTPVDVRVSTQNGVSGNANITARIPGAGQPCYLPPAVLDNTLLTANPSYCSLNALP